MKLWKSVTLAALVFAPVVVAAPAYAQRNRNNGQAATVVVFNYQRVLSESNAGRGMSAALQQIGQQIGQEAQTLGPEEQAIEQERARLEASTRNQTAEQRANNPAVQALMTRVQQFQTRRAQLQGDFECTRLIALRTFDQQISPVVRSVMQARGAGVVIDAAAVQLHAPEADVTNDVLTQVNTAVPSISVTRHPAAECTGQGQAAQQPAAAPAQ